MNLITASLHSVCDTVQALSEKYPDMEEAATLLSQQRLTSTKSDISVGTEHPFVGNPDVSLSRKKSLGLFTQ